MTASELLKDLTARNVRLAAADGRLRVEAPAGTLTDVDRSALTEHKDELLMLLGGVLEGDCRAVLPTLPAGCADLVFSDIPFNQGVDYPGYKDDLPEAEYLNLQGECFVAALRELSPTGSFWVASGARYQAEVLVMLKRLGLHWRNTVVWHYTFGQNQKQKFTPSWVALHYLVRDPRRFTFNADAVRVMSARQTDYNDKRANPKGKVPDDVWVLRPQEAEEMGLFDPTFDCWHVPRVNGTFKERVDHPCQMPQAVLERIILACTNPGDLVLDPMCGPGTTLVAARRLGRRSIGVELCPATAALARERLARAGSAEEGSESGKGASPPSPEQPAAPAWDQPAADALMAEVQARRRQLFGEEGWPEDENECRRLGPLMDTVDAAWAARDLGRLGQTVTELLMALDAAAGTVGKAEDEAVSIARALGLLQGNVALWEPHRCSYWCRCHGGG
ncbi:MAG TPA: DNA methyltransferase [Gemmataceae bacterium]|nr:DNA methyltransferase [Gemmataceae bacterium]